MTQFTNTIHNRDAALIAAGFQPRGDGSLRSPGRITLTPAGEFYRLTLELPSARS